MPVEDSSAAAGRSVLRIRTRSKRWPTFVREARADRKRLRPSPERDAKMACEMDGEWFLLAFSL